MAEGSGLTADIRLEDVPLISPDIDDYIRQKSIPGGTLRNWDSYGHRIAFVNPAQAERAKILLADPQTSGGLLISVAAEGLAAVQGVLLANGLEAFTRPLGQFTTEADIAVRVH
jgi:selenide,water dikinase